MAALVLLFAVSIGGPVLLVTFAAAGVIHILQQPGHLGVLLIYTAAVVAVMGGGARG